MGHRTGLIFSGEEVPDKTEVGIKIFHVLPYCDNTPSFVNCSANGITKGFQLGLGLKTLWV